MLLTEYLNEYEDMGLEEIFILAVTSHAGKQYTAYDSIIEALIDLDWHAIRFIRERERSATVTVYKLDISQAKAYCKEDPVFVYEDCGDIFFDEPIYVMPFVNELEQYCVEITRGCILEGGDEN